MKIKLNMKILTINDGINRILLNCGSTSQNSSLFLALNLLFIAEREISSFTLYVYYSLK